MFEEGNMWQPEMELIDQLEGGSIPLNIGRSIFKDDDRARRVLTIYVDRGVIVLNRDGLPLETWEAQQLLRNEKDLLTRDGFRLALTQAGARAFNSERWKKVS